MISETTPLGEVLRQYPEHRAKVIYQLRLAGLSNEDSLADSSLSAQLVASLNSIVQEPAVMSQVRITEVAAEQLKQISQSEGMPNASLRISIAGANCSGYHCMMEFDDQIDKNDLVFEQHGVKLLVSLDDIGNLFGAEIDFHSSALEAGFKINNPNKPRGGCRCSC